MGRVKWAVITYIGLLRSNTEFPTATLIATVGKLPGTVGFSDISVFCSWTPEIAERVEGVNHG